MIAALNVSGATIVLVLWVVKPTDVTFLECWSPVVGPVEEGLQFVFWARVAPSEHERLDDHSPAPIAGGPGHVWESCQFVPSVSWQAPPPSVDCDLLASIRLKQFRIRCGGKAIQQPQETPTTEPSLMISRREIRSRGKFSLDCGGQRIQKCRSIPVPAMPHGAVCFEKPFQEGGKRSVVAHE
jgi:hypothetical protein